MAHIWRRSHLKSEIFLWLSIIWLFPYQAAAANSCIEIFQTPTSNFNELAREAAALFKESEKELAIRIHTQGPQANAQDLNVGSRLRELADTLSAVPGDHHTFLSPIYELASVLLGEIPIRKYSRREQIGYIWPANLSKLSAHWNKLETVKYTNLYGNVYVKQNAQVEPNMANELVRFVLTHPLGRVKLVRNNERSNEIINVEEFDFLSIRSELEVYHVTGYTVTVKESGQKRVVIRDIQRASPTYEASYYKSQAARLGIKDVTINLSRRIGGRDKLIIPDRIIYKIEHKHQIRIEDLFEIIKAGEFTKFEATGQNGIFYSLEAVYGSRTIRLIVGIDPKSYSSFILKTTYYLETTLEEIYKDLSSPD